MNNIQSVLFAKTIHYLNFEIIFASLHSLYYKNTNTRSNDDAPWIMSNDDESWIMSNDAL